MQPETPARDEGQVSAGAEWAPASLLHTWKAAVPLPLSRSMQRGRAGGDRQHPRSTASFVHARDLAKLRRQTLASDDKRACATSRILYIAMEGRERRA